MEQSDLIGLRAVIDFINYEGVITAVRPMLDLGKIGHEKITRIVPAYIELDGLIQAHPDRVSIFLGEEIV